MNENILTENEEKILVLMLLHTMSRGGMNGPQLNTDDRLRKSLGFSVTDFSKLMKNLEVKGLVSDTEAANGRRHITENGFFQAEKIYITRLFHTGTKAGWVTPSG